MMLYTEPIVLKPRTWLYMLPILVIGAFYISIGHQINTTFPFYIGIAFILIFLSVFCSSIEK
ncbi:MAG: hypothetical protein C4330_04355 [Chitinophagaceae bacterium]